MKKFIATMFVCFILLVTIAPCLNVFATDIINTALPEPVATDWNYWYGMGNYTTNYLYYLGIFANSGVDPRAISVTFTTSNVDGNYHILITNSDVNYAVSFLRIRYKFDGTYVAYGTGTVNANSTYTMNTNLSWSTYNNYYISPNFLNGVSQPSSVGNPGLLNINWNSNLDYESEITSDLSNLHTDLLSITSILNNIYSRQNNILTTEQSINNNIGTILNNWTWFKTTFYNDILHQWAITNDNLDEIIDLLGGSEDVPEYSTEAGFEEEVSGYVEQESELMSEFNNIDLDSQFDFAEQRLFAWGNSFAFIRSLFNTFIGDSSNYGVNYIIITFSLIFGVIIVIIGKQI